MNRLLALCATFLFGAPALGAQPPPATFAGTLAADTVWKGEVAIAEPVVVPEGITLTVEAGAKVLFAPAGQLEVHGRLQSLGTAEKPVEFLPRDPASPTWGGIAVVQAPIPAELRFTRISGAKLDVIESGLAAFDCISEDTEVGFFFTNGKRSKVERCRFSRIAKIGAAISRSSVVEIVNCVFDRCEGAGVEVDQQGGARVADSRFTGGANGVVVSGSKALIERNQIEKTGSGIVVLQTGEDVELLNNRISEASIGIVCRQFASPKISGNRLISNAEGINCYFGSNPEISQNLFENNKKALSCTQLAAPVVTRNVFTGNHSAIYLTLSSYPVIRDNNFTQNALHLELDTMSADWERRVMKKETRGKAARNLTLVQKGRAVPESSPDFMPDNDYVEASGNWWGPETTREMTAKGPEANITAIKDYYDEPRRAYEGYEGTYLQDRVRYAGWRTGPVPDAGPPEPADAREKAEPPKKAPPAAPAEEKRK